MVHFTSMKKAVLAGIRTDQRETDFNAAMNETESLCRACDIEVCAVIVQTSRSMDPNTAFRSGKLNELAALVSETEAELVVFHNPLRIQTAERISAAADVNVIDRTALILDIFAKRARSTQAKLQVEMARLQYDLPRELNSSADESGHERGGSAYNRGAGEMRSRLIRRTYSSRIAALKKELEKIRKQKYQDERRRTRTLMRRAALVGYTNAGKSSLMNAMLKIGGAGKSVYEEDMLFATLDTSVRMIESGSRKFLLYDTVGFVSDLPHSLIDAFQATLDAARDADLLLHVIDSSDEEWQRKAEITEDTLREIGAGDIPVLRIFTKCDLAEHTPDEERIYVSSVTGEGTERMMNEILIRLYPPEETIVCRIPYDRMGTADRYRAALIMKEIESTQDSVIMRITGPKRYTEAFADYRIRNGEHYL